LGLDDNVSWLPDLSVSEYRHGTSPRFPLILPLTFLSVSQANTPPFNPYPLLLVALNPILTAKEISVRLGLLMNKRQRRGFVDFSESTRTPANALFPPVLRWSGP
jgi:hypothetical protein